MADSTGPKSDLRNGPAPVNDEEPATLSPQSGPDLEDVRRQIRTAPQPGNEEAVSRPTDPAVAGVTQRLDQLERAVNERLSNLETQVRNLRALAPGVAPTDFVMIPSATPDVPDIRVSRPSATFYSLHEFIQNGGSVTLLSVRPATDGDGRPVLDAEGNHLRAGLFRLTLNGTETTAEVPSTAKGLINLGVEINKMMREQGAISRITNTPADPGEILH